LDLPIPNKLKNLRLACCSIGTEFFAVLVTLAPTSSRPAFTFGIYFFDVFLTIETPLVNVFFTAVRLLEEKIRLFE
jgi:hypothetical protein